MDFTQGPASGKTHPMGVQMLEMLGFSKIDYSKILDDEVDGNSVRCYIIFAYSTQATDFKLDGTTTTQVGEVHFISLLAFNDAGELTPLIRPDRYISTAIRNVTSGNTVEGWWRDNGDDTIALGFYAEEPGIVEMEIQLTRNPLFNLEFSVAEGNWPCCLISHPP